ncbi:hypothetical protein D3C78_1186690 [compost metagenome]
MPGVGNFAIGHFRRQRLATALTQQQAFVTGSRRPTGLFRLLHQPFGHWQQIEHVRSGVDTLFFRQRTRQPVSPGFAFIQLHLHVLRHQGSEATRHRTTGKGRQDLGIHHRGRQRFERVEEHFQILTAGVQEFHHLSVAQQLDKRLPLLDRQGVNQGELFTIV